MWDLFSLWLLSLYLGEGSSWEAQSASITGSFEEELESESGQSDSLGLLESEDYFIDGGSEAWCDLSEYALELDLGDK